MIVQPTTGLSSDFNIDLWSISVRDLATMLDAVSIDSFLNHVFSVLLHREPDGSGVEHYRNRILQGHSRQSVVRDVLVAPEFRRRHGAKERSSQPLEDFVNQTYQDVLGRWPDEDGRQTYMRIGRKWRGRSRVEKNILNSAEALRLGGGRLARIRVLQGYARGARWLKLPIVGQRLRRRNDLMARLVRIELRLAGQPGGQNYISAPAPVLSAEAISSLPAAFDAVPTAPEMAETSRLDHSLLREARIETLDPDTASKLEKDGWVFRVTLRNARRQDAARIPASRTRPSAMKGR